MGKTSSKKGRRESIGSRSKRSKTIEREEPKPEPKEDLNDVPTNVLLIESAKTLGLMLLFAVPPLILIRLAYSIDALEFMFYPVQIVETLGAYLIVKLFGVSVTLAEGNTRLNFDIDGVVHDDFRVIPACTALMEIGFWIGLVMGYRGTKVRTRALWAMGGAGFLFIENIIRIAANYPIMLYVGEAGWHDYHMFWLEWGQLAVVGLMFLVFAFFTRKQLAQVFQSGVAKAEEELEPEPEPKKRSSYRSKRKKEAFK